MSYNIEQKKIRCPRKFWLKISITLLGISILCLSLFFHPQYFFQWSTTVDNLSLYSDEPFSAESGEKLLKQVQSKLSASPLYSTDEKYAIFICNSPWRRSIFFIGDENAGGIVYYPLSSNVFINGGDIEENRKISLSGMSDVLGRKLDHFIAHEIAHILNGKAIGWIQFHYEPIWIKEGYAEYIGSQGIFNYDEAAYAFMNNSSKMNLPPSIPYLRYNLLAEYLLEKKNWKEKDFFETALSQSGAEQMLKAEMSQQE
ncbi:MAG: hypothetical protein U0V02_11045 [Anaerolineales bacterium]